MENQEKDKSRKSIIAAGILVAVLVMGTLGATYAYFAASIGTGATSSVTINSKTVDNLTYTAGSALTLTLTQTNMEKGSADTYVNSNTVTPSVKLVPRNDVSSTVTSKYCYNISLKATTNALTAQAAKTLTATVKLGSTACASAVDVTALAAGKSQVLCSKQAIQATSYSASGVTNSYSAYLSFLNSSTVDQSSLAGKDLFTGTIVFETVAC